MSYLTDPLMVWVKVFLGAHRSRLRAAWQDNDRGASAVELAIIAGMLCFIAAGILVIIKVFVLKESALIKAPAP